MQWHLLLVASLVAGSKEVEVDCVRISVFLVWVKFVRGIKVLGAGDSW